MDNRQKKVDKQNVQDILSLTPMQEGMLFHYLENQGSTMYVEQLSLQLAGQIDIQIMKQAWVEVVTVNEMLRTVFRWEKLPKPMQIILKEYHPPIRFNDLTDLDLSEKEKRVNEIREKDLKEGIDIRTEPFRITLIKLSDHEAMMIICNHHILFDGWSNGIILKEFLQAYSSLSDGNIFSRPNKRPFNEFVKWLQSQDQVAQNQYWTQYLEGFETKTLLPKTLDQQSKKSEMERYYCLLDDDTTNRMNQFVTANRITSATVFNIAWGLLLQRYNNTDDVVFGTTVSGRSGALKGLEEMVGLFINTIPFRVKANFEKSILTLLKDADQDLKARTTYENVPLVDIKSCSMIDPQESLFDSIVVIENYPLDKQLNEMNNQLKIESYSMVESTHFDLTLLIEMNDQIQIQFSYNQFTLSEKLIQKLSKYFCNILNYILENPDEKISEIEMLTEEEQDMILYEFNDTYIDYSRDKTLNQLFEEQVEKVPDQIAVVYEDQHLTYRELNEKANRLARTLRDKGVTADSIVGILTERSFEMMIGIMAILKAGGAYLPITPEYPEDRIQYILQDSNTEIFLTQSQHIEKVSFTGEVIDLTDELVYSSNGENLETINTAKNIAYVIYTSGSTGQPKGVLVEHQSVVNILTNMQRDYPLMEDGTYLLKTTYTFDVSVTELFGWYMCAGRMAILPPGGEKNPHIILEAIDKYNVTHMNFVPSMLNVFIDGIREEDFRKLKSLRYLFVAGEAFSKELAKRCSAKLKNITVENIYGPTETTIYVTRYSTRHLKEKSFVPIGKPLNNVKAYIVNKHNKLLPIGAAGELCIAGECLARGYFNREDLTAEKFVTNPFVSGEKMYRTGDLVRWLPDGNIEFLGRIDHQVKIRGFRIELGEIESQLLSYDTIKEALVMDREDQNGAKYLCAYLVADQEVTVGELREFLLRSLPEYMIPSYFVQLEQMPLNANGKADRKALPEPEGKVNLGTEYEAPQNDVEERLVSIWQDVLGIDQIGINDNFFELGGHSLKATRILGKIYKEFDVEIPIKQIFTTPTINGLGACIKDTVYTAYAAIEKVPEKEFYETSSAQKRLYMIQQLDLESTGYNMSAVFEVEGPLDRAKVKKAFYDLIWRHENLRTSFARVDESIVQKVHREIEFNIELIALDKSQIVKGKDVVERVVTEAMQQFVRPFDLSQAPLFRVGMISIDAERHILLFDMHHIISDGTSMTILIDELGRLYEGQKLDELRIQYRDYAEWQSRFLQSADLERQKEYWINQFADDVPVLNLPTDAPRPAVQSLEGDSFTYKLDRVLTDQLKKMGQMMGSTMYMVLLSGLNILLAKYSGQDDIIVGSPIAGRPHPDLEKIMGIFINTLAMRNQPRGQKKYTEFLAEVQINALKAYENQDYQFEKLIDQLNLNRDLSRSPLFDVMFAMQNMEQGEMKVQNLIFTSYPYTNQRTKFDLTIQASEIAEGMILEFEYCSKLFKPETIKQMVLHLRNILQGISVNPEIRLSEIDMLTAEERDRLLYEFNDTAAEYPWEKTIHQLFAEQVEQTPDQVAVFFASQQLTYWELNEKADCFARLLCEKGVQKDTIVGIMVERSIEMVIGVLAILKAGGAYLPIDLKYPADRIQYMLEDCAVNILLTQGDVASEISYEMEWINILDETICSLQVQNQRVMKDWEYYHHTANQLACIIYTSGSTGKPKGVMIEHRNVIRLVKDTNYVEFQPGSKLLQTGTLAFDASTFELWGTLLNGLELHLAPKDLILNAEQMERYLIDHQISNLFLTTSLLNLFADERPSMFRNLLNLLTGGEAISSKHVHKVQKVCKQLNIINLYGPTENTTVSTSYQIGPDELQQIPIGKPIANSTTYILDQDSNLVPIGVYGELCVGGGGLARGYLNRPELTEEKFVENPYLPGERIYKTGDLARWLPDGNIEFLGRVDYQVKIRGFRIEPGEIEKCLLEYELIKEAIVIADQDEQGNKYLVAYVVTQEEVTNGEIRGFLVNHLPDYMIPAYFIQLDTMPLNANGKIDRKALPRPEGDMITGAEYESPRNEREEKLVAIWQEVLGVDQLGINDNFFELGGHSLKATILVGKIHQAFDVEVPLNQIFTSPTIKEISDYVQSATRVAYSTIEKAAEQEVYLASSAQKRIYLLQQFDLASTGYNIPGVLLLEGKVDVERVRTVFQNLMNRHETLRTSFEMIEGEIVQRIHQGLEFTVEHLEAKRLLQAVAEEIVSQGKIDENPMVQREAIEKLAVKKAVTKFIRPFDLNQAPLIRAGLIQLEESRYILMFDMHHIISDGTSMAILINEFSSLYEGQGLAELRIQYKDFAEWQHEFLQSELLQKQEEYWVNQFADEVPVLNLPTDYSRPAVQSMEGETIHFFLDRALTDDLKRMARETGSTLYMVLLAGLNILLAKYSGQEDIVVGSPIAGRPHTDLEQMIGMFVNTLAMRNQPIGTKTYTDFLGEVKANALQAYENQDYQFEELVERLQIKKDLSRSPLFDVFFALQNMGMNHLQLSDLTITSYSYENMISKFDLSLFATETGEGIRVDLEYCTQLFKRSTMERLFSHWRNILQAVVAKPDIQLHAISLLDQAEKMKILHEFNRTSVDYPRTATLQTLFEERVEQVPEQFAIVFGKETLTYGELNTRANQLARTLRNKGVQGDSIVAIMVERSLEMLVGIFGILKAGGAYLPIAPEYPEDRIQYLLSDSQAEIILTQSQYLEKLTELNIDVFDLADEKIYGTDGSNLEPITTANHLAYVIYTSGSTGKPKGVMAEHQSVVNILTNLEIDYPLTVEDAYLLKTTYTFDVSVTELFGWFIGQGRLVILPPGGEKELSIIVETISEHKVTHVNFVPSMLSVLLNGLNEGDREKLQRLKYIFVAGEAFPKELCRRCQVKLSHVMVENIYGPTETTIYVTRFSTRHLQETNIIPIGQPLNNVRAYILDSMHNLLPIGVAGELCIAGECVTRGYLNRLELTAEKFIADPFVTGEQMYRTGDLARWLPDGNIEFLGRIDHQVKIRGFRIELGEIENRLLAYDLITDAVVVERQDEQGDKYLCAYFVASREIPVGEIREYLLNYLPDYMIPSYFIQLDVMPLNKNAKVDRKALPDPDGLIITGRKYEAPRNELEVKLVEIWKDVLRIDQVGINDHFFELGGHSLKATILSGRIHKELQVTVPLREIFKAPTIQGISKYIQRANQTAYLAIKKVAEQDYYATSSAQKRMYMLQQFDSHSTAYNMPGALILEGTINVEQVGHAFQKLIERHETLRSSFAMIEGEIVQEIQVDVDFAIQNLDDSQLWEGVAEEIATMREPVKEISFHAEAARELIISSVVQEFVRPFDLSQAPLLRVGMMHLEGNKHLLIFDLHHIISDGTSLAVLLNEFTGLYNGEELTELQIQYKDYAAWQNQFLHSELVQEQEVYWGERFSDEVPILNLPTDYSRPAVQSLEGDTVQLILDQELTDALKKIASETGSTLYMVLLSGINILLTKYSGQEDIVIGSPIAGRPHADLEKMIGMFVNTLAMRNQPEGDMSYQNFLKEVKNNALQAYQNQDYQFEELVEQLNVSRDLSRNPLFDVMFVLQNMSDGEFQLENVKVTPFELANQIAKFDLTITANEKEEAIYLDLNYCAKLFKKYTVERMAIHLKNIFTAITVNPALPLAEIQMLTLEEKEQVLYEFNDTIREYPSEKLVHELFEEQVERVPEQIAVRYESQQLSYRDLNAKANCLARTLREHGVQAGSIVGLMVDRSLEMLIGILGILKAGGAYLPINSSYPMERIRYMLEDSGALLLLTHEHLLPTIDSNLCPISPLDGVALAQGTDTNLKPLQQPEDMAYVIYTSGSTGQPKGVMVPHRALNNFVFSMYHSLDEEVGVADRCLSLTNISFDVSVCEIFLPLTFGATLVLFNNEIIPDIQKLAGSIIEEEITFAYIPPTILAQVYQQLAQAEVKLNKLLVGVEPIKDSVLEEYLSLHPKMQILNGYGPTEATICATFYPYGQMAPIGRNVPIGKPLANTQIYLLDSNLRPVPVGVAGELCIAGDGLAIGYLNRPELTEEKFVSNPFINGTRMYRTGDLARWLPDGNVEFLGRIDQQVKIRGFRIEPGEIENQLLQHKLIQETIVIVKEDESGIKYLVAYLVADQALSVSSVREHLLETLPEYMIPSYFIQLDQMPLTANGKINRRSLPNPQENLVVGTEYVAPTTRMEIALVKIWQEILEIERVGINDNFFELGGHSLKATVLVAKIHQELNVSLSLSEIFKRPTIKELAQYVAGSDQNLYSAIQRVEEQAFYQTSSAQKRIYLQCQFEDVGLSYNMPGAVEIEGPLNHDRIQQVFQQLVCRHETLRTSFEIVEGEVIQRVAEDMEFAIGFINGEQGNEVEEIRISQILDQFLRPFTLERAPLIRVALAQLADERYLMCFDLHHIISDGISMENLIKEFVRLYQGEELSELKIQYKDFAAWQNQLFQTKAMEKLEEYWLETFAGEIPVLNMPTDYPRPAIQSFSGNTLCSELDEELAVQLRELAIQTGSTIYMVLLAAYNLLLYKYTGQEDLVIGSPIAGRGHADLQNIIGMFVNMLALRNTPAGNVSFGEFLSDVKKKTLHAFDHQEYQFEELVEKLNLRRDLSRNPLFDVVFALKNMSGQSVGETGDLRLIPYNFESSISQFDLTLEVIEEMDRMWLSLEYCTDLFSRETMERFSGHYINILRQITNNVDLKLGEVNILSEAEKKQLLEGFNDTEMEFARDKTLHQLIQEQVERTPERTALVFENERLTYQELNTKANQLACLLRELGLAPDQIVAIMAERSIEIIIGMLAVLKAGGAYMPIDPEYPAERMIYMLEDSQAQILLTHNNYANEIEYNGKVIDLANRDIYTGDGCNLNNINKPRDLAYVMYTSGSTGKPKGVMIEHQGIVSLSKYYNQMFKLDQKKNILHLSNVSFDTSVVEIYPPLIYGATIYVIGKELALDRKQFGEFVRENQIHFAQFVPMMLQEILGHSERLESLETVIVGGDKLDDSLKDQTLSLGYQLTNHYGPTEATVDAIVARCVTGKGTIGKPIANAQIYILDQDNNATPVGVPGELCICGVGLARGYLNRPDLTAEKFVSNPFVPGERMYRTGDLACWQSDGNITFLGRIDNQVKIRGYRIELGEIEEQLHKHQDVTGAVVLDKIDANGIKYLCAYIVVEDKLTVGEIKEYLSKELPEYMIPSCFVQLDKMPITHNGKIDRGALPEPETGIDSGIEYQAPTNRIEEKLVTIWQEVLGVEGIGIHHNFFDLGGHSMKATVLVSKIHKELNVEVPLGDVFKNPTIRELAQQIVTMEESLYSSIQPIDEQEYYPVSSAQRRLYILCQFKGANSSSQYNMPGALTIEGALNLNQLEIAFQKLVRRHEILRTSFEMIDGEIVQKVHKNVEFLVSYLDSSEEETNEIIQKFVRPFNLSHAPLLRVGLIKLAQERYLLLFDMHHIISDGTSIDILVREFIALYQGTNLSELKIQYKDFSAWQNELYKTDTIVCQDQYWLDSFAKKVPMLKMPFDYPRPVIQSFDGDLIVFELDQELTQKFNIFCKEMEATSFMTLLAIYNVLLFKYTRQKDITVGIPIAGRPHVDLQGIIGMFVNTLVMRNAPIGSKTFYEFAQEVKENALKAFENQDYQFEHLVNQLDLQRDSSRNPLFDVAFSVQNANNAEMEIDGLKITPYSFDQIKTKFDLTLNVVLGSGKIIFNLEYCTELYKKETIEKMADHILLILSQVLNNPETTLSDVSLYSEEDRKQLIKTLRPKKVEDSSNDQIAQKQSKEIEADFDF